MRHAGNFLLVVFGASVVCACASDGRLGRAAGPGAEVQLSEGYTLLHVLLRKQANVQHIFILKSGSDEFKGAIRQIAEVSSDAAGQIAAFAEADAAISLEGGGLPRIEAEARDSIEADTRGDLLGSGGREFEVLLAVEQMKATRYGAHLARTIAARETNDERRRFLETFANEYSALHDRLLQILISAGEGEERADE